MHLVFPSALLSDVWINTPGLCADQVQVVVLDTEH